MSRSKQSRRNVLTGPGPTASGGVPASETLLFVAPLTNRHLAHYVVGPKLGEGGMGVVYKGTDTRLKREVALKFLTKALPLEASERKRFLREAQAASAINHPNVCVIHALEEVEGERFLVMEFVEGLTLRQWVCRRKTDYGTSTLPVKDVVGMALQIAEGLDAAHRKGIVHRDIKPDNVMVCEDGRAKIMDFGLAKLAGESRITRQGSTVGTVAYMSPEQVQGGEVDHQSDIYSFGILLYEMLSGTIPFQADHAIGMMYSIVNSEPIPVTAARSGIDETIATIVMKCIAKDKHVRYASMKEVLAELIPYARQTNTLVAPALPAFSTGKRTIRAWSGSVAAYAMKNRYATSLVVLGVVMGIVILANMSRALPDPKLTVSSTPAGSQVFINGREVGLTPLSGYRVGAGRQAVRLEKESFIAVDTTIEVVKGKDGSLEILLRPIPVGRTGRRNSGSGQLAGSGGGGSAAKVRSVDDLASSLVRQLRGSVKPVRGAIAVRPFTFQHTQIGSEFSRYFRSVLERRGGMLANWPMLSTDDGSGGGVSAAGRSLEYEITGTYWDLPDQLRFFALLRNPQTFVVVAQAEADVSKEEVRKLGIAWLPGNYKQLLDDTARLGNPVPETGDLGLELFTNKGAENLVFVDGEVLAISVKVNKPCIVRAFYHTVDGRKYLLTGPNDMTIGTSKVNAVVPIKTVGCTAPFGAEIIQVFATTGEFEPIQTRLSENRFYELQEKVEKAMTLTRGIKQVGDPVPVEKRIVVTTVAK